MNKIADNFCGYLKIADDMFVYTVSDSIVTLLPAQSDSRNRYDVFHRMRTRNFEQPEFLFGEDSDGMIAMLWNGTYSFSGINTSARFSTPIIIKAAGNTDYFWNMLTEDWRKFHAITFYGGNINAVCNPEVAVARPNIEGALKNEGANEIKLRPWNDYVREVECEIDHEKVTITISVLQSGQNYDAERKGAYSLGELNSCIRLSFEKAQDFDKIGRYYLVVKEMIALLTSQNNIVFDVYLSQRNSDNRFFKSGSCKIFDRYKDYSTRKWHNVISVYSMLDYLPKMIEKIAGDEIASLLAVLPDDNRSVSRISITNIQDLCTALEVAYKWEQREREKDILIEALKKDIRETIAAFTAKHKEISIYQETTISSAFQYLDYTLRQRVLTLYNENSKVVDEVSTRLSLPQVNEENIAAFVKLRNNKTHSGTVEWGESAKIYLPLFALVYTCFFKYIGMPDEAIEAAVSQII